jgi:hypothetical protein
MVGLKVSDRSCAHELAARLQLGGRIAPHVFEILHPDQHSRFTTEVTQRLGLAHLVSRSMIKEPVAHHNIIPVRYQR